MKWLGLREDNGKDVFLNVEEISSIQEVECANGAIYISVRMRNGSIFGSTGGIMKEIMDRVYELS